MENITDRLEPFISEEEVKGLVKRLGREISEAYRDKISESQKLILVVTLKGALFFAADLVREITIPVEIDFVRVSSYGNALKHSGNINILKDLDQDAQGHHVLILDEIVDSGHTLSFLQNRLLPAKPASVKVCALLSKPSRREIPVTIDFLGREVEDKFLVGYGLDFAETCRNLSSVYALKA